MEFQVGDQVLIRNRGQCAHGWVEGEMDDWFDNQTVLTVKSISDCISAGVGGPRWSFAPNDLLPADPGLREKLRQKEEQAMKTPLSELIQLGEDCLSRCVGKGDPDNNGVAVHVKRGQTPSVSTGPCHGFIRDRGCPLSACIVTLMVREKQAQVEKPVLETYYEWLMSRSPWAFCFTSRSGKRAVETGMAVLRCDVPANLLQGALISTRNTWEYKGAVNLWYKLVNLGVEENMAFVAAHMASFSDDQVVMSSVHADHVAISTNNMTKEGLKAFVQGVPLYSSTRYDRGGSYEGVILAWTGKGQPLFGSLKGEFNTFGKKDSIIRNPFIKAKVRKDTGEKAMSVKEYAEFVKKVFPKYIQD